LVVVLGILLVALLQIYYKIGETAHSILCFFSFVIRFFGIPKVAEKEKAEAL